MITMYDADSEVNIPLDAQVAAGYVDGSKSYGRICAKVPRATHMSITLSADLPADCLDVEGDAAKHYQVVGWVKKQHELGKARPVIYASPSNMTLAKADLDAAGIARSSYRLWSADYPYSTDKMLDLATNHPAEMEALNKRWAHICGPTTCNHLTFAVDGTQFTCRARCLNLDQSLLLDSFFGEAKPPTVYVCEGHKSLQGLSQQLNNAPSTMLRLTAEHSPGGKFYSGIAGYLNGVFAADRVNVPQYVDVYYPKSPSDPTPERFHSHGDQTLQGLANSFGCKPADIVQYTAENSPDKVFAKEMADYLNAVFARSTTHVPTGTHLFHQK
jgi:hypothetical protein